jgi:hypothetical protein
MTKRGEMARDVRAGIARSAADGGILTVDNQDVHPVSRKPGAHFFIIGG